MKDVNVHGIEEDGTGQFTEKELREIFLSAAETLPRPGIHLDGIRNRIELHLHLNDPRVVDAVIRILESGGGKLEVKGEVPVKVTIDPERAS